MDNMHLWTKVSKTDPAHTKKVNQRGGFTAIDAHYQIQEATRAFGPVGIGWGYTVEHSTTQAGAIVLAVADVIMWHGSRDTCFGPIRGMSEILGKNGHIDTDAAKKETTDAITKALSHLGFNADVFLGLFDDNKYVSKLTEEFSKPELASRESVEKIRELLTSANSTEEGICSYYKCKSLDQLTAAQAAQAINGLIRKINENKAA